MFWKSKKTHLPLPEGPFVPGCIDVMTEFAPDGCFFRLFYPTSLQNSESNQERWIPWVDHPEYGKGFALILGLWYFVLRIFIWLVSGTIHIPAVWEAPIKNQEKKFPVVIFSHGLGACRFFYSGTYAELASQGFVVAAMEHRDTSACATFYYKSLKDYKKDNRTWIRHHKMSFGLENFPARVKQLRKRAVECSRTLDLLEKINAGVPVSNILCGKFSLECMKGRLDVSNTVMMGHSFGGATALLALHNDRRFKLGVILDAWMYTLKDEPHIPDGVKQPLIFINTETFHIASNLATMEKYLEVPSGAERSVYTLRMTTHENQTDTVHVVGYWLDWFMKKMDPVLASQINHALILQFLFKQADINNSRILKFLDDHSDKFVNDVIRKDVKPRRT